MTTQADPSNLPPTPCAIILAGGLGSRLREAVSDRPKVLAEVAGRPFIEYLLDQVADAGIHHAVLCVGYLAEQVEAHLGSTYRGVQLSYSRERALLGTGGALRYALPLTRSDTLLVMNGDSFLDADLPTFRAQHEAAGARVSLLLAPVDDTGRYGRVNTDGLNHVTSFDEKGAVRGPGWVNAGIYLIDRELLKSIPNGRNCSLEKEIFPEWIGPGFFGFKSTASTFIDIGTPTSLREAQSIFAASIG